MGRLLLVSNRLPVSVKLERGRLAVTPSTGGLATGLRGPHQRSQGLWLGWPGEVGRLSAEERARLDEQLAALRVVPLYLSQAEVDRYYQDFSNRVLWPLFHYLLDRVPQDERNWEAYRRVNRRFADLVAAHHRPGDTIWVHDYQLLLVPQMVREQIPEARIGFFLHIPFPSTELFRTLPWRAAILEGLLGADLIGFHAFPYLRHFSRALVRILGIQPTVDRVEHRGRTVRIGAFPMGIDAPAFDALGADPEVLREAQSIRERGAGRQIVLGIDRLDYTKGIPRRLLAIERLLEREPSLRGRMRLIQVAVPSRAMIDQYQELRGQVDQIVGRVNGAFGTVDWMPIHYLYRAFGERQLGALYRAADVMLVTPLRDGMNLVAKEFVAARGDEQGVLVLSELAGAAAELGEALQVNPYDVGGTAQAIRRALMMSPEEQRIRMRALRGHVLGHDIHRWAAEFIAALDECPAQPPAIAPSSGAEVSAAEERVHAAERLLLLLDYDGTLVPLAERPELAAPDGGLRLLLGRLAARPGTRVHVVSGRARGVLEQWLGDLPIGLHAEHGFWSRPARGAAWTALVDSLPEWKGAARAILEQFAARTPGAFVEEKSASLAWHYRTAEAEFGRRQAQELLLHLGELFANLPVAVIHASQAVELRMQGVDKGRVVAGAAAAFARAPLIVAMGDDGADLPLFDALPADGLTVRVGPNPVRAQLRLADPAAARGFLGSLLAS